MTQVGELGEYKVGELAPILSMRWITSASLGSFGVLAVWAATL
jgi:hypothetical protein